MRTPPNERVSSDISDGTKARTPKSEPERRCILSGENGARHALIRLAISPDGDVLPDVLARAPGRGAWIGVSRAELEAVMGAKGKLRGALARAFKGAPLNVPETLPQLIQQALEKALLERLGLEMRSGHLILGSDRIAEHARSGALELLLHAADASEGGARKLDQAWRVGKDIEGSGARGIRLPLDRAALSVALGRENVVHLGVEGRKAADRVEQTLSRLLHFAGPRESAPDNGGKDSLAAAKRHDD
ncbi:DUF448 domain-containing protein [Erythrobacter litoralis]|uniref:Transcription terminating nucleic-acid-binding protein n=1 Tax=Erythrobacter litoralis (strain HTCC2594) TaxID=314225 RepID=Q2NC11_ERYLH|nr:DUF448 domain-containing protein [Erythrobacter litoralis]ABC62780.1 transcription terminating nucleic-acid-binding protein [Erythrobacter litoralis HTCC2594]